MIVRVSLTLLVLTLGGPLVLAQEAKLPPGDDKPLLRLEGGGPAGNVTALAFSPDGKRLFAAGFDKVVRVWTLDAKTGRFELDATSSYRVPIGPGTRGAINALALSADGTWLAVGGLGVVRTGLGFHDVGKLWPAVGGLTAQMRQDEGLVYVFHTARRELRLLRGHSGSVESLAFVPPRAGKPLLLISAAQGWDEAAGKKIGEVRVWDVAKEETLAARSDLPAPSSPPGLAAVHTGDKPAEVRVVLAWGDETLRLWDVARADNKLLKAADGKFNTNVALQPDQKKVLTSSFRGRSGRLQVWDVTGAAAEEDKKRFVNYNEANGVFYLPKALALMSAGEGERAAVVVRGHVARDRTETDFLQLIDLRPGSFGKRTKAVTLWDNPSIRPVLAAAADGRHVAVAGSSDHSIRLWLVADLLQERDQPQVLASAGATMRSVALVRKADKQGSRLGLLLGEQPDQPGDLVFDFQKRTLSANMEGWKADEPDRGNWAVQTAKVEGRTVVTVLEGGQPRARLDNWRQQQRVDAITLLPPALAPKVPLVAVAVYDLRAGEPLLDLYHAGTGEHCRRFTGHLARIRAIAFSRDGRLLASVADDQTACIWSLTDLGDILGKFGQLPGVAVRQGGKGNVLVAQVAEGSAAAGKLQPEDLVEGQVVKGELQALKAPEDFYDAAMMAAPGKTMTLRVRSEGGKARDVELTVGQGVDVRTPLLTLFVTRPEAGKGRDWLGWNPTGPYDSSRDEAEKHLGWHLNTGKKEAPTTFTLIGEYRKKYYTPGILNHLVAQGNLRDALKKVERPVPLPELAALVGEDVADEGKDGQVFVRQHQGVRVQLAIQDYTPEPGDVLQWQLDDGKPQAFGPPEGSLWQTPPLPLPARRGVHTVRVLMRLPAPQGQVIEARKVLRLRYQPPAPTIEARLPADALVVNTEKLPLHAAVRAALPDLEVTVNLIHQVGGKEKKETYLVGKDASLKLPKELVLGEGVNLITLTAENKDALPSYEENERAVPRSVKILYEKKPIPRPVIALKQIHPVSRGLASPAKNIVSGQAVVVDVPRVRITGQIKAEAELKEALRLPGADAPAVQLASFKPGSKEHPIDEPVALKPGRQTFLLRATAIGSKEQAEESVTVFYRPQLPRLELTTPEPGTVLYEEKDRDAGEVRVEGKLLAPEEPSPVAFPLKAAVLVNGRQVIAPTALKAGAADLAFPTIPLVPGDNLVQVQLSHEWGGEPSVGILEVRYLRPPRILEAAAGKVGEKPYLDLLAKVYSPLPLHEVVRLQVQGSEADPVRIEAGSGGAQGVVGVQVQPSKQPRVWEVRLTAVPLPAKENTVRLWVRNAEGESRQAGVVEKVVYVPPPKLPPPPQILILAPASGPVMLPEPKLAVRFRVRSEGPLKRVVLTTGERKLFDAAPEALAGGKLGAQGFVEFQTGPLSLDWGLSDLHVEALNEGGRGEAAVTVNLVSRPVELSLDLLQAPAPQVETVPAELKEGKLVFPAVNHGRVWLHGTVRWSSKDDTQLQRARGVRVYVNGFQQLGAELQPPAAGSRARKFKADLLLAPGSNKVLVLLPDLEQDASNRREFAVVRQRPLTPQDPRPHLHVLLVAPGYKDGSSLRDHLLEALKASSAGPDLYRTGAFEQVRIYPLPAYAPRGAVFTQLRHIERALAQRAARGATNDVVMVYYLGKQTLLAAERFYWTSDTRPGAQLRSTALNLQFLVDTYFDRFAGAQVVLLDVAPGVRPATTSLQETTPPWPGSYRFAVLRHTTLQPSATGQSQLLELLRQHMPQASSLRELDSTLQALFREGNSQANLGVYDPHLPAYLEIRFNAP